MTFKLEDITGEFDTEFTFIQWNKNLKIKLLYNLIYIPIPLKIVVTIGVENEESERNCAIVGVAKLVIKNTKLPLSSKQKKDVVKIVTQNVISKLESDLAPHLHEKTLSFSASDEEFDLVYQNMLDNETRLN